MLDPPRLSLPKRTTCSNPRGGAVVLLAEHDLVVLLLEHYDARENRTCSRENRSRASSGASEYGKKKRRTAWHDVAVAPRKIARTTDCDSPKTEPVPAR